MFEILGSSVSGSILAAIATIFCFVAVWFWRHGADSRERSRFAVTFGNEVGKDDSGNLNEGCGKFIQYTCVMILQPSFTFDRYTPLYCIASGARDL